MGMLKVLSDTSIRPTLAEPSFPRKWESGISGFQSFPIDSRRVRGLDSRLRGNDESIRTETCTTSFLRTYIPSFPRKWESRISGFQSFPIDSRRVVGLDSRLRGNDGFQDYGVVGRVSRLRCCRNATEPSFPRKWESRISGFQSFPIDSRRVGGLDSRLRGNDGVQDYGVSGMTVRVFPRPPRVCKRQVNQKCRLKVQTASVSGNQKW